jgi:hypothetical protein
MWACGPRVVGQSGPKWPAQSGQGETHRLGLTLGQTDLCPCSPLALPCSTPTPFSLLTITSARLWWRSPPSSVPNGPALTDLHSHPGRFARASSGVCSEASRWLGFRPPDVAVPRRCSGCLTAVLWYKLAGDHGLLVLASLGAGGAVALPCRYHTVS